MPSYLNQTAFAKKFGVSRQAVSLAVQEGRILSTARGIDPAHPTNRYYVDSVDPARQEWSSKKKGRKAAPKSKAARSKKAKKGNGGRALATRSKPKAGPSRPPGTKPADPSTGYVEPLDAVHNKNDAEIQRIKVQTKLQNVRLAERMRVLILRSEVNAAFGKIHAVAANHFLPLGDRLAPILAGICGTSDRKKTIKLKKKIDAEISRGLKEIKRLAADGIE